MKNIFRFLMAVAVLFTASCAKEDISSSIGSGEVEMTFTVDLPELGTRAYGDGTKATTLRYYVFDGDNYLPGISSESLPEKKVTLTNGKAVVTLPLLKGMIYNIIFWADKGGCYTIDTDTKTVTVDYAKAFANDDNCDAFYKYLSNVDPTDDDKIKEQTNVTLTRPFGQLNAATSDFDTVVKNEVTLTTSTLEVTANKTLDLTTGMGSNQDTFSFKPTAIPAETLPNKPDYKYLSMNYLIPGNVDAEFTFKGTRNNGDEVTFTGTSYTNVPVKANYRTNILGALLTKPTAFNVEILPGFGGEEEYDVEDIHVATAQQLQEAVEAVAATGGEIVLVDDINLSEILVIGGESTISTSSTRTTATRNVVIDGKGKTLTSTAARAINISGDVNVTIKNLIINASGERAINIIQNAKNVTIENVTATAANYTVNVAASAPNAVVAINNSILNGLCTVNVAGAGAQVTLNGGTVNCIDNNTTAGESYAALSLNKDAVGGSIIATNTTVNVTEGSDSMKGRNGAEDGTVTIDGSTEGVAVMVAAITYPDSDYYHAFATLQAAIEFAKAGDTIQLIRDITFDENNRTHNSGTYYDGLYYIGDKSFTIDLGGNTIGQNGAVNDYLLNFKNNGEKANTITLMNGTVDAGTVAYCALCTSTSNTNKITINLEGVNLVGNNSNGAVAKIRGGAELNVNAGTEITGKDSYVGIEAVGNNTVVNIYEGAKIYQKGTSSYVGSLAGASGGATINVYGGEGVSAKGGFIAMTSGGTINISGGNWTANTDGTYANGNNSVLIAQSEKGWQSTINVTGGTFKGGYNCYGANVGDAEINISGGNFNANPSAYVVAGKAATENNGTWTIIDAVSTAEALAAALAQGGVVTLGADITVSETIVVPEGVTATLDLNGFAISVIESTGKHIYALNNKGILTIKDSKGNGSITARGIYNGYDGSNTNNTVAGAKMTVESGKLVGMDTDGGAAVFNCAELIINGGDFTGGVASVNNRVMGSAIINGGNYSGVSSSSYQIQNNGGQLTINNANVTGGFGAVGCYSGTTTIKNGTFLPTGRVAATCHVVYVAGDANVTINGGTFKMNYPANAVPDSGSAVASYFSGKLAITDGTFYSHFDNVSPVELSTNSTITGGTYYIHSGAASNHPYITKYVAEGYELNANGEVVAK